MRELGLPVQTWKAGRERLGGNRGMIERLGRLTVLARAASRSPHAALRLGRDVAGGRNSVRAGLEVLDHWARTIVKIRRSHRHDGIRIFDEGAFHLFYLLAYRIEISELRIEDRLNRLFPIVPDLVIIGEASADVIRQRLASASEPSMLRRSLLADPQAVERAIAILAWLRDSILDVSERAGFDVLLLDMERDDALSTNVERVVATIERAFRNPEGTSSHR